MGLELTEANRELVESAVSKYPFFAMGRMMLAKVATKLGDAQAQPLRFLASLYAPSRPHYAFFLEEKLRPKVAPPPRLQGPTGREAETPSTSTKSPSDESPASQEEPNEGAMAYSPAFWPPLQGRLAARLTLYKNLSTRLFEQLTFPTPSLLPSEAALSSGVEAVQPLPLGPPQEASEAKLEEHLEDTQAPPTAFEEVVKPVLKAVDPSPLQHQLILPSPALWLLQVEPPLAKGRSPQASSNDVLTSSDSPVVVSATETAPLAEPVPPPPAEKPLETIPMPDLPASSFASSAEAEGSAPLTESSTLTSPTMEAGSLSFFHRAYQPLEDPKASIHLPTHTPPEASEPPKPDEGDISFVSESPIRTLTVPFDIDVSASIHLPIPEPSEEPSPPPASTTLSSPEAPPSAPSVSIPKKWQSFLQEFQEQSFLSEVGPSPVSKELENLRREFIRKLLAQRIIQPVFSEKESRSNLIDQLIERLQSFPKSPPVERELGELTVPVWEAPAAEPKAYTETMARLYWRQGDTARAIQVYERLMERHPEKADFYQAQIARIRAGEPPP
ncbi:MAG: tetratricopeptide repeat protein [Bacteroidia bacterium]